VGGLSVLKAIRDVMPQEHLLYVADSANAPYGDRQVDFIAERAIELTEFLVESNAKAIVVACNTATVVAIAKLRSAFKIPIIAIEPAIKPAVMLTKSGIIGVLATRRTLESPAVADLCRQHGEATRILLQPCPGLVEQVESGEANSEHTRQLLERYIAPLLAEGADTLVLGCTHYPFLERQIRLLIDDQITLIEPSTAVAQQLQRRLMANMNTDASATVQASFFTTGSPDKAHDLFSMLWGGKVTVQSLV
jgi:glutamate racemase